MFILKIGGWFMSSCILMSFIEHQVHSKLMHRKNFLSPHTASFKRVGGGKQGRCAGTTCAER
jgi:hypothetical protein